MDYFDIPLENDLWQDFISLKNQPDIFKNYENYFNTLVTWVKKHKSHIESINHELLVSNRLDTVLDVDIEKYLSKNPEILLDMEIKRVFTRRPKTIDSLLMRIGDTLWELVRCHSGKDCPSCIDAELNYILAEIRDTKQRKIVSECDTCGYAENLDGSKYADEYADGYPVNDDDLAKYGVAKRLSTS